MLTGLSGRVSYVYKNMRNVWGEIDLVRAPGLHRAVHHQRPGPGQRRRHRRRPDVPDLRLARPASAQDRVYTNPEGNDADFHTVELAVNRRFSGKWMLLTSFGYTWSTMLHDTHADRRRSPRLHPSTRIRPVDAPVRRRIGRETSTLWNYKVIGRYVLPCDIGFSGSWKVQSGQQLRPHHQRAVPGRRRAHHPRRADRREPLPDRLDPRLPPRQVVHAAEAGRQAHVPGRRLQPGQHGAITLFRQTTVNYREVTETLAPRIFRVGFR